MVIVIERVLNMDMKKELKRVREQQTRLEAQQELLLEIMTDFWPKVAKESNDIVEEVKVEDLAEWFAKSPAEDCHLRVSKTEAGYDLAFEPQQPSRELLWYDELYWRLVENADQLKEVKNKVEVLKEII
jgi:hypothetical protein